MKTKSVEEIYEQHIQSLPVVHRLRLLKLIAHGLVATVCHDFPPSRSVLELEGLGAEIWQGISAQAYVNELRGEWDQRR